MICGTSPSSAADSQCSALPFQTHHDIASLQPSFEVAMKIISLFKDPRAQTFFSRTQECLPMDCSTHPTNTQSFDGF